MDEHNPYSASTAAISDAPQLLDIESTTKVRRFLNWLIDKIVFYVIWIGIGVVAVLIGGESAMKWFDELHWSMDYALTYATLVVYYTFMEGAFGFTIGKLITQTRVVDQYGRQPTFWRAFLRSLGRLIPFDAFSLLMSEDHIRRGWHDSLAKTYVIDRPRDGMPAGKPRHSISDQFAGGVLPQAARPNAVTTTAEISP
ncbi:hypothetical protein ASE35_19690 [Lysobacter sp. Root916]|uniref:RDD family protein n=1 Tax=Lysobacter sp. Root916 TaxID=1736606 RepID=UPI00070F9BE0|nr:RDD family protein [Lysobacter sp. Root916]KRD28719.1 hypothetical protein ASE35_19690 [Lysobacter sp. Root916]